MLIKLDTKKYFTFSKFLVACLVIIVALLFVYYFLNQPPEESVGVLNIRRIDHSATLLNDGRILIVGGRTKLSSNTAEIYDPKTNISRLLKARTNLPHKRHTAHVLRNGTVVIIDKNGIEEFDPKTETFKFITKMIYPRDDWNSILLPDDKILILGGTHFCDEGFFLIDIECFHVEGGPIADLIYIPESKKLLHVKKLPNYKYGYFPPIYFDEANIFNFYNKYLYKFSWKDKNFLKTKKILLPLDNNEITAIMKGNNDEIIFILKDEEDDYSFYFYSYNIKSNVLKLINKKRISYLSFIDFIRLTYDKILIYSRNDDDIIFYNIRTNKFVDTNITYDGGEILELKNKKVLIFGQGNRLDLDDYIDNFVCRSNLLNIFCYTGSKNIREL